VCLERPKPRREFRHLLHRHQSSRRLWYTQAFKDISACCHRLATVHTDIMSRDAPSKASTICRRGSASVVCR
jgi:hypothetical protein